MYGNQNYGNYGTMNTMNNIPSEKSSGKGNIFLILILLVIVGVGSFYVGKSFSSSSCEAKDDAKDTDKQEDNQLASNNDESKPESVKTHIVKFGDYSFSLPINIAAESHNLENGTKALNLFDDTERWSAVLYEVSGNYSNYLSNIDKYKRSYSSDGYTVGKAEERKSNGVSMLVMELTKDGKSFLLCHTRASSGKVFVLEVYSQDNSFSYESLDIVSVVFKKVEYMTVEDPLVNSINMKNIEDFGV